MLAVYLGLLGVDFTVTEPQELVDRVKLLAGRYARAGPAERPPSSGSEAGVAASSGRGAVRRDLCSASAIANVEHTRSISVPQRDVRRWDGAGAAGRRMSATTSTGTILHRHVDLRRDAITGGDCRRDAD